MAQLVVRKLDDDVKKRLRLRAARNGHSMEEEVREILTAAVVEEESDDRAGNEVENDPRARRGGLGSEIAALFAHIEGPPFTIEEIQWGATRPFPFEEFTDDDGDEVEGDLSVNSQGFAP